MGNLLSNSKSTVLAPIPTTKPYNSINMKLAGGCFIALALCTHVNAINFWLAEKDGASSCFDGAHDCGTTYSATVITGNGNTPGCKDGDK